MRRLEGRSSWKTRVVVYALTVAFTCAAAGVRPLPAGATLRGERTSDAAAGAAAAGEDSVARPLAAWRPGGEFFAAAARSDTTEVEFPEDAEGKREHLYRDIGVFLIVSAFVGYFIVKVFLQGDTDEPPPSGGGKDIPGP